MSTSDVLLSGLMQKMSMAGVSLTGDLRIPFYFGSEMLIQQDLSQKLLNAESKGLNDIMSSLLSKSIRMLINPTRISIRQGKRIQENNTYAGKAYTFFLDKDGYANDPVKITFEGETGNINPSMPGGDQKMLQYLQLHDLSAEPRVWVNTKANNAICVNHSFCLMTSQAVPFGILFYGFFNEVMTIEDDSSKPNMKNWKLDFTAEYTYPNIAKMSKYLVPTLLTPGVIYSLVHSK